MAKTHLKHIVSHFYLKSLLFHHITCMQEVQHPVVPLVTILPSCPMPKVCFASLDFLPRRMYCHSDITAVVEVFTECVR